MKPRRHGDIFEDILKGDHALIADLLRADIGSAWTILAVRHSTLKYGARLSPAFEDAVETLVFPAARRLLASMLLPVVRAKLLERDGATNLPPRQRRAIVNAAMDAAIVEIVHRRLRGDSFDRLVEGLNGKHRVMPRATADALLQERRSQRRQTAPRAELAESYHTPAARRRRPLPADIQRACDRLLAKGLEPSLKNLAHEIGITVQWLRRRLAPFRRS